MSTKFKKLSIQTVNQKKLDFEKVPVNWDTKRQKYEGGRNKTQNTFKFFSLDKWLKIKIILDHVFKKM